MTLFPFYLVYRGGVNKKEEQIEYNLLLTIVATVKPHNEYCYFLRIEDTYMLAGHGQLLQFCYQYGLTS